MSTAHFLKGEAPRVWDPELVRSLSRCHSAISLDECPSLALCSLSSDLGRLVSHTYWGSERSQAHSIQDMVLKNIILLSD